MTTDQQPELNFLWMSAHEYFASQPSLSRHLSGSMAAITCEKGIEFSSALENRICPQCGALLIPGVSSSTRIVKFSELPKDERRRAMVEYQRSHDSAAAAGDQSTPVVFKTAIRVKCLQCNSFTSHPGLLRKPKESEDGVSKKKGGKKTNIELKKPGAKLNAIQRRQVDKVVTVSRAVVQQEFEEGRRASIESNSASSKQSAKSRLSMFLTDVSSPAPKSKR